MLENWKLVYIRSLRNQEINKELENTSTFANLTNIWRLTHEFWVVGLAFFFFISRLAQLWCYNLAKLILWSKRH